MSVRIDWDSDIYNFIVRVDARLYNFVDMQLDSFEIAVVADFLERSAKWMRTAISDRGDFDSWNHPQV